MDYGDLVTFKYNPVNPRRSTSGGAPPTVLILHPNYGGMVHAIKWDLLSPGQQNIMRMILDPEFAEEKKQSLVRQDPQSVKLYDDVTQSATVEDIRRPEQFYNQVIKILIGRLKGQRQSDPYRQYRFDRISNIRTLTTSAIMTGKQKTFGRKIKGAVRKLGKKMGLWESYVQKSRGTRGPKLPNRAPNFRKNK